MSEMPVENLVLDLAAAMGHLRKLLDATKIEKNSYCPFCREWLTRQTEDHKPDCPYVAAAAFVEGLSVPVPVAPREV